MKILYLNLDRGVPVLGDKGASVHVRAFIEAASALGHDVALACATLGEGNPPPPARIIHLDYPSAGAPPTPNKTAQRELARLSYDRAAPLRLRAALEAEGFVPDIVYERHALFHTAGVAIADQLGIPRLLEVNAPLVDEQRKFRGLSMQAEALAAELESYRGADVVIAVSNAVAAHVADVLGRVDAAHVAPNGVDLSLFSAANPSRAAMRRRLGFGAEPVIGFVGSFKPWHGMLQLLEVFASLAWRRPGIRLLAVGEGPEREAVQSRADALGLTGQVILPGRAPHAEIPAWLSAMDVTVAPYHARSDFYFSPLKIVESMAAGRPVVAPRIGQIESLVEDGVTGRLYNPDDMIACRSALGALIDDPWALESMGARAAVQAATFSWREVVARILALAPAKPVREAAA